MNHYFVVLELPGGKELKFNPKKGSPKNFWKCASTAIANGQAKIISKRQDTGVSEELRRHLLNVTKFTTYVLVHLHLCPKESAASTDLLKKIAAFNPDESNGIVIDYADNFQLVTVDAAG